MTTFGVDRPHTGSEEGLSNMKFYLGVLRWSRNVTQRTTYINIAALQPISILSTESKSRLASCLPDSVPLPIHLVISSRLIIDEEWPLRGIPEAAISHCHIIQSDGLCTLTVAFGLVSEGKASWPGRPPPKRKVARILPVIGRIPRNRHKNC